MAAPPSVLLLSTLLLLILLPFALSQSAPAPAPSGQINVNKILSKDNNYNSFITLLKDTHSDDQINNQVNNSPDGMTLFAPTDNAFNNLPSGTLNNLTVQQHVQLVQYHIIPKFYSLEDFRSVSNPVHTQAGGGPGQVFGLYIMAMANQVNVSTGIVAVPVYNAVRKDRPLAIYQVDKVLLPKEFYEAPPPSSDSPPAPPAASGSGKKGGSGGAAAAPASGKPGNGAGGMSVGMGMVTMVGLVVMGFLI